MNAGGVPNACKSNGDLAIDPSGKRVSNTWVTYPGVGNNDPKGSLIPHPLERGKRPAREALWEGPAAHQVVGVVTAHQADDG